MIVNSSDQSTGKAQATTEGEAVMSLGQRRFYASDECLSARIALQHMVDSPQYNTESDYFSSSDRDFIDRHLHYLSTHPTLNLEGYISNLKLMTSTRQRG